MKSEKAESHRKAAEGMIHSDWHIHSEFSYDAKTELETIAKNGQAQGLRWVGITDHANFNDEKFLSDFRASA